MNTNYINIERAEYDRLKRCEIALELLFNSEYKDGIPSYISSEKESAFSLIYAKEIEAIKAGKTASKPQTEFPALPSEQVGQNDD